MEQQQYLIDTNVVIDYLGKKLPATAMAFLNDVIDSIPNVSIITRIEVLGFSTSEDNYQLLESFMNDATVLDLTEDVANQSIQIRKTRKTKLPDAIIAATAMIYDLALITRNIDDFKNIPNLKVVNPWEK
ncbi:MAG TPA: type II toxin-antitoxin system VapC family toxin [Bacteroidales bacterium]|nr:type II toxin-antitoxin system VapC family toxin [Bacteroidales bacterium]HSA44113.1 type II toxin-antitoxin system VapC family toxin [Bacteroidales bacterium]